MLRARLPLPGPKHKLALKLAPGMPQPPRRGAATKPEPAAAAPPAMHAYYARCYGAGRWQTRLLPALLADPPLGYIVNRYGARGETPADAARIAWTPPGLDAFAVRPGVAVTRTLQQRRPDRSSTLDVYWLDPASVMPVAALDLRGPECVLDMVPASLLFACFFPGHCTRHGRGMMMATKLTKEPRPSGRE
jgi:16S rRNA C967 or C1407 C5-methylase (RsmB/RsmF family)